MLASSRRLSTPGEPSEPSESSRIQLYPEGRIRPLLRSAVFFRLLYRRFSNRLALDVESR
jgi:hypothetical protein